MTVENISRPISKKECCRPRWGLDPQPPGLQSGAHPTEQLRPALVAVKLNKIYKDCPLIAHVFPIPEDTVFQASCIKSLSSGSSSTII